MSLMMAMVRLAVLAVEITLRLIFAVLRALTGFRWRFPRFYLPRIFLAAAATVLVCAGVGFAVGSSARTSSAEAATVRTLAIQAAAQRARSENLTAGKARGYAAGLSTGKRLGTTRGRRAGAIAAQKAAEVVAAREAAARAVREHRAEQSRESCVKIEPNNEGPCDLPGPTVTGHPCPQGYVPNADHGVVCVPT